MQVSGDAARQIIRVQAPRTLCLLNFSGQWQAVDAPAGWVPVLTSHPAAAPEQLAPYSALIFERP